MFWLSRGAVSSFFYERGLKAKNEWRLQSAINYFDWSLFFKENADSRFEKGASLQLRGNFLASQTEFEILLKANTEDQKNLARLYNAIGVNQYSFAEPEAAAASHQKALELARNVGGRRLEAKILIDLSRVYYHSQGKFDEALANLEEAKTISREISDQKIEAAALRNLGVLYWWFKSELERPLNEFYFPALELYRRADDRRGAATMLTLIALVFNNKGDIYRFMQYQNESIEIQRQIGDEAGLSDSYLAMGILYDETGNYRKAQEFLEKGLAITKRTGYLLTQNEIETMLAGVRINLGEYEAAIKILEDILGREKSNPVLAKYRLQTIAHCYLLKKNYSKALVLSEKALEMNRQIGSPDVRFVANILLTICEVYIALGDWQKALESLVRANEIYEKVEVHSAGDIQRATLQAMIARHEHQDEAALNYLRDALETERQIFAAAKTNLLVPPSRRHYERLFEFLLGYSTSQTNIKESKLAGELIFGFLENLRYRSLRNFLIQIREKRVPDTLPTAAQEKELSAKINTLSRYLKTQPDEAVREQLKKIYREYEELTLRTLLEQPQYLAIRAARPVTLADLQEKLSGETALVEFLPVGEHIFALVITKKNLQSILLPVSKNNLAAKTKIFRSVLFMNEINENEWLPVAESLRADLIEPLDTAGALTDVKKIGFVPFGFLHDLPFAALARHENGEIRFLVEDYILFQTPSATFFADQTGEKNADSPKPVIITFGRNDFSEENLPSLEFAAEEAEAVAQTTGGTALVGQQATETELKLSSRHCDYLHLSTHAVVESEMPLFSRLLLEPNDTEDGQLTVREIFELGLQTKLVTLSACETGQSFYAGENDFIEKDRLGLIEAFLHAGSQSVLASQFPISDRATLEFMKKFYANLRENEPTEALAQTQRAMIRGAISTPEKNFRSPRFWSPFILVGSDR